MPAPTSQLAQEFHETNRRLRTCMEGILTSSMAGTELRAVTSDDMAALLSELMRAGARLRTMPTDEDHALEQELAEYRKHVERLRNLMPAIHRSLLREKARLEQEQYRLSAAAKWANISRQTL